MQGNPLKTVLGRGWVMQGALLSNCVAEEWNQVLLQESVHVAIVVTPFWKSNRRVPPFGFLLFCPLRILKLYF